MREKKLAESYFYFLEFCCKKKREKKIQIHAYLMHICKNEKKNKCIFNAYTRLAQYKIYQKHIIKKLNYYQN